MQLVAATLTPFDARGAVDRSALADHARRLLASGADALAPTGTTGEFLYLREAEKRAVHSATLRACGGRPVMPCTWDTDFAAVLRLSHAAADGGARAIFLPPPLYHRVPDDTIRRWYARVKEAARIPVLAYEQPAANNGIGEGLLAAMLAAGEVDGIKDSSGDPARIARLAAAHPGAVWAGVDRVAPAIAGIPGVVGFISKFANLGPRTLRAILDGAPPPPGWGERLAAVDRAGGLPAMKSLLGLGSRFPLDGAGRLEGIPGPE